MGLQRRVFLYWLLVVLTFLGSLLLPHESVSITAFGGYVIQLLLLIICIFTIRHEPIKANKLIFLNFAVFFGLSIFYHVYGFVGTIILRGNPFARFYVNQYLFFAFYSFLLSFSIVYLTIDVVFREYRILQKYLLSILIVGGFFTYYYLPILENPKYLYSTGDIVDWKSLNSSFVEYEKTHGAPPSPFELAQVTKDHNAYSLGSTNFAISLERVKELYPYLSGSNYKVLLYKPLYMNSIYMGILCIGFIFLFFGYQYLKDPPQGAYIEKIMFLLLVFCSLEVLHAWSFAKTVEWEAYSEIVGVGRYISLGVLSLMVLAFWARLRFISSPKGEFYEQEIASSPQSVTRWRDGIDNIIIDSFFDRKAILGRMFVDPSTKEGKT